MSKPRHKGATIGVRLPLSIDANVRRSAAEKEISPSEWIETVIVAGFRGRSEQTRAERVKEVRVQTAQEAVAGINGHQSAQVSDCRHEDVLRHQTGLQICKSCHAVSRDRGNTWQVSAP